MVAVVIVMVIMGGGTCGAKFEHVNGSAAENKRRKGILKIDGKTRLQKIGKSQIDG